MQRFHRVKGESAMFRRLLSMAVAVVEVGMTGALLVTLLNTRSQIPRPNFELAEDLLPGNPLAESTWCDWMD